MALHLRRALAADDTEVPDHFEGLALKGGVRLAAWPVGLLLTAGGVRAMLRHAGGPAEIAGAVAAAIGCITLFAVIRCGRFETEIGRQWLKIGAGPLKRRIRKGLIEGVERRPATGWRRLYADTEITVRLGVGEDLAVPTRDPEEFERFFV